MNPHQVTKIDGRIDLGGCERRVPEQLLYRPEVHAGLQQMGRKSVAKGVRVERERAGTPIHRSIDKAATRSIGQAAAPLVDKESVVSPV